MKPTAITAVLVTALASSAGAAPVLESRQGLFGSAANIIGSLIDTGVSVFDTAACAASSVVTLGRSRLCFNKNGNGGGDGVGVALNINAGKDGDDDDDDDDDNDSSSSNSNSSSSQEDNSYDFEYKTVGDKYEIKITPKAKGKEPCTDKYDKDGDIQKIVAEAAEDCLRQ